MPITFNCACGKSLRVSDEHAGRRVKCPACAAVATVPAPEPMFEVVEDVSEPIAPPPPPKARPVAKPSAARDDEDDDDDDRRGYGVAKKKKSRDEDDEEEEEKPRKKKKKPKWKNKSADRESASSGSSSAGAEIAGGLISMLIGGILCFLVWTNRDAISPLGIILVIAGLIGIIKGLAGGSSE